MKQLYYEIRDSLQIGISLVVKQTAFLKLGNTALNEDIVLTFWPMTDGVQFDTCLEEVQRRGNAPS